MEHTHTQICTSYVSEDVNSHFPFSFSLCQSLVACDPVDVRNARNAVIEALPHMLSSMALLWGVVMREESQRRASDSAQSSRHTSTSVYFKSTKVCVTYVHIYCITNVFNNRSVSFMLYVFFDPVICLHIIS